MDNYIENKIYVKMVEDLEIECIHSAYDEDIGFGPMFIEYVEKRMQEEYGVRFDALEYDYDGRGKWKIVDSDKFFLAIMSTS